MTKISSRTSFCRRSAGSSSDAAATTASLGTARGGPPVSPISAAENGIPGTNTMS